MNKLRSLGVIVFLLLGCLFSKHIQAQSDADTLSFLHISDTHLILSPASYLDALVDSRKLKHYDEGERRLRQFLKTIPEKTNCNMVMLTGDLVDFWQAETSQDNMLGGLQQQQFARLISDCPVTVYLTLGNHDIFSFYWKDNKLKHNQNFSGRSRAAWIKNIPCFRDGTYYSKIFRVGSTTYRLIFLDDSFYQFSRTDKTAVTPYIDKSQLYWLNNQLRESDDDIEIVLMHIPLMNSEKHPLAGNELYAALSKDPSCKLILAGHHHKNIIKRFPSTGENEIVQVQTGALVKDEGNWRKIQLTEKNILVSVPGKLENELVIPVK